MLRRFLLGFLLVPFTLVALLSEAVCHPRDPEAILVGVIAALGSFLALHNGFPFVLIILVMVALGLSAALHR